MQRKLIRMVAIEWPRADSVEEARGPNSKVDNLADEWDSR